MKRSPHHESHGKADHEHQHGVIDPKIAGTRRGKWAVKWSFAVLQQLDFLSNVVIHVDPLDSSGEAFHLTSETHSYDQKE